MGIEFRDLVSVMSGLLGTIIGALFSFWLIRRQQKRDVAANLHAEFSNPEYSDHRRKAYDFVKNNPQLRWEEIREVDTDISISLDLIMRIYLRIWFLTKNGLVNKKAITELFANNFYQYYYIIFEPSIPREWEAHKRLMELANWFEKNLSKKRHDELKSVNQQRREKFLAQS